MTIISNTKELPWTPLRCYSVKDEAEAREIAVKARETGKTLRENLGLPRPTSQHAGRAAKSQMQSMVTDDITKSVFYQPIIKMPKDCGCGLCCL